MITDLIDVEPLLGQHDPGMILVGPLLSHSLNSGYRYFYIAGSGSKVYETISLFVEVEADAQTQRADFIEKLERRFAEVLTFGSHLEMAHAVHTRWPNKETAKFLAFAELEAKPKPAKVAGQQKSIGGNGSYAGAVPGDNGKQLVDEVAPEPVDHAKHIDAISTHAPPLAFDQAQPMPVSCPVQTLMPSTPPIATPNQPLRGDRAATQQLRHSGLSQDDIASAILRLKSPSKLGSVRRLPVEGARSSIMLRFCAVGCAVALVAALATWAMLRPTMWQVADEAVPAPIPAPSISFSRNKDPSQAVVAVPPSVPNQLAEADEPALQAVPAPATVPPSPPSQPSQVTSVQAGAAPVSGPQSPPAPSTATRLDAEEIVTLVSRGTDFMKSGNLASARLLLRRAAEAGSASAALMLGTTFDPLVIQQFGAIGIVPDVAQARQWYEKAVALGSDAASQRLAKLPQTGQ
jgi:hypothetical protein